MLEVGVINDIRNAFKKGFEQRENMGDDLAYMWEDESCTRSTYRLDPSLQLSRAAAGQ